MNLEQDTEPSQRSSLHIIPSMAMGLMAGCVVTSKTFNYLMHDGGISGTDNETVKGLMACMLTFPLALGAIAVGTGLTYALSEVIGSYISRRTSDNQ